MVASEIRKQFHAHFVKIQSWAFDLFIVLRNFTPNIATAIF